MKKSFETVVSIEDLDRYVNLAMYDHTNDESFRLDAYKTEEEDYKLHLKEESFREKIRHCFKNMTARQWIDVQKWLFPRHKDLIKKVNPEYSSYPFYQVARNGIRSSTKVKKVNKDGGGVALEYSKEEEEEIINWWLNLKWEYRASYDVMNEIHGAIRHILPAKLDYARNTDPIEKQSDNKDEFISHSWELIKRGTDLIN